MKFHLRDLFWLVLVAAFCALWLRDRLQLNKLAAERTQEATAQRKAMQFLMQFQSQNFGPLTPAPQPVLPVSGAGDGSELRGAN